MENIKIAGKKPKTHEEELAENISAAVDNDAAGVKADLKALLEELKEGNPHIEALIAKLEGAQDGELKQLAEQIHKLGASIKMYFDGHDVEDLHFTSDNQAFFQSDDAHNHAKYLHSQKRGTHNVTSVKRSQYEKAFVKPAKKQEEIPAGNGTGEPETIAPETATAPKTKKGK